MSDTVGPGVILRSPTPSETATSTRGLAVGRMLESCWCSVRCKARCPWTVTRPCQSPTTSRSCSWNSTSASDQASQEHTMSSAHSARTARVSSTVESRGLANRAAPLELGDDTEMSRAGPTAPGGGTARHNADRCVPDHPTTMKTRYFQRDTARSPQATPQGCARSGRGTEDDARQPVSAGIVDTGALAIITARATPGSISRRAALNGSPQLRRFRS